VRRGGQDWLRSPVILTGAHVRTERPPDAGGSHRRALAPSVPAEAFWQLDRLKIFDMTAQLQHDIERFRRRAAFQAGGQVVPPLLKLVQHVRQRLHSISPPFRSTAPIGRPTVPDNHRRLRRRSRGSNLAPRPVGRGSLGGGRGTIAAGWWSWHPGLISRDASRVQWIGVPS